MILHDNAQVELLVLTVLLVIAGLRCNHEHRIFTAFAADMLDFLMLAFALASSFHNNLATTRRARVRVADCQHLHVRLVVANGMHSDDLAHTAHHRDRIAGLERFCLGLRFDVRHFRHLHRVGMMMRFVVRIVLLILSVCKSSEYDHRAEHEGCDHTE